jgi:fructoselysine-6-P-deglycase FrlB-like protein
MHFAGAQAAALARELFGLDVRAWRSMDLRWAARHFTPRDLVVCASVSGRTPRTLEAAQLAREAGARVLGISDNPDSPLDRALYGCLILGTAPAGDLTRIAYAGYKNHVAQTQTFTCVLAVELLLCATFAEDSPAIDDLPSRMRGMLPELEANAERLAGPFLQGGANVLVLGSGPHLPLARYGAAKFLEFAIPAQAQCLEEANHLDCFVADAATRAIFLAADPASLARTEELLGPWAELGVESLVLSPHASSSATTHMSLPMGDLLEGVLAECLSLQCLAAHGVSALGRDPDQWLGGRRTELVQSVSARTIRDSKLWSGPG